MGNGPSKGISCAIQAASDPEIRETISGLTDEDRSRLQTGLAGFIDMPTPMATPMTTPQRESAKDPAMDFVALSSLDSTSSSRAKRKTSKSMDEICGTPGRLSGLRPIREKLAVAVRKQNENGRLNGKKPLNLCRSRAVLYELWSDGRFEDIFEVGSVVGEGGFGQVLMAESKKDGAKRAVKTMQKSTDKDIIDMQLNEVRTLIHCDHPHIVKLFMYYESNTDIKLVFEFCKGPDLLDKIINGPMDLRKATIALRHMLKALKYCHDSYFGHYDVKPENFMYSGLSETNLKMIDFGFSGAFMQGDGRARGTISYMAPEVVNGTLGPEADVWSCGAVLFAMLTTWEFTDLDPEGDPDDLMNVLKERFQDRRWAKQRLAEAANELGFPSEVRELLTKMLIHDRHMRPTVLQALRDPLITQTYIEPVHTTDADARAKDVLDNFVTNLRRFAQRPLLKRSAILVMSHSVSCGDGTCKDQRIAYRKLDKIGSGDLSVDSLESGMEMNRLAIPADLDVLFNYLDNDHDGYISFVDFLSATLPKSITIDTIQCEKVFAVLDVNKDGIVDASDLVRAFQFEKDDAVAKKLCEDAIVEAEMTATGFTCEEFIMFMQ